LINAITVPPEVQEMINRATGIAAQDTDKYRAIAASDAMRDAARNPGAAGTAAGAGVGFGIGLGLSQQMANALQNQGSASPTPRASQNAAPASRISPDELKSRLQNLKALKDEGLISDSDFEEQKHRLLSQL
jgi:membrane protease subunit (stomatin/prohibitin family)